MTIRFLKTKLRRSISALALFGISSLITSGLAIATETATATFTDSLVSPGVWQYNLDLNDTGSTTIGTFWFSWIPGDNFMPATPTSITTPAGWTSAITAGGPSAGSAIRWVAAAAADDLTAGNSLAGFSFESSLSPAQLEGPSSGSPAHAVDTAVIYSGTPFSDAGFTLQATPAVTASPEPASVALGGLGLGILLVGIGISTRRS